jgi:phosphatidylethanolamine/phosphatidyl-N-methylethanolamine N-methyltransferase
MDLSEFYDKYYRHSSESWMVRLNHSYSHKMLERGVSQAYDKVLELGAGSGEHSNFVTHSFSYYLLSDLRDSTKLELQDKRFEFKKFDAQQIPLENDSFDRIISTCLLHHVSDVKKTLSEMRRVIKNRGLISINIAADPGFMYRNVWNLTSGRRLHRQGLMFPRSIHYQEHRGHFMAIMEITKDVFHLDTVKLRYYPFTFIPSHNSNIFAVIQIQVNKA